MPTKHVSTENIKQHLFYHLPQAQQLYSIKNLYLPGYNIRKQKYHTWIKNINSWLQQTKIPGASHQLSIFPLSAVVQHITQLAQIDSSVWWDESTTYNSNYLVHSCCCWHCHLQQKYESSYSCHVSYLPKYMTIPPS